MPKFLFGRISVIATQVEAPDEESAVTLLNESNELMNKGAKTPLPGVGKTHAYKKAWVAQEGTLAKGKHMIYNEIREIIWYMDEDGSPKPEIYDGNGKIANGPSNPRS